jgi:hypothetical protein
MMNIALALFALAAVAGLSMAVNHFRGRTPPAPAVAALHGIFAASGLVTLLLAVLQAGATGGSRTALGLFLVAALGGFGLLSFHLRGRKLPNALVAGHALLAVAAFAILCLAMFTASR